MLRKLMKHEFRATGRIMLPLLMLTLVTAVGANLSTRILLETDNNALNILGMLLLTAFVIAISAVCLVSFILMIHRFYKNLLQDEGYVMMTLPVSVHKHIFSKLLVSLVWFALSAVVVVAAFFILVYELGMVRGIFNDIGYAFDALLASEYAPHAAGYVIELIALILFSGAASCLQFYMAAAIGHSFASKKLLMSVVVYFAVQFLLQILMGVFMGILDAGGLVQVFGTYFSGLSSAAAAHWVMIGLALISLIFAAIFYFPTVWFLTKRLNLE